MHRLSIIILSLIPYLSSCAQNAGIKQLNSLEFQKLTATDKGILLDVRTPSEFSNGHIQNSGNLNYYALDFSKKLELLPKDQPIYLYCNTGYRSEKAAEILTEKGYTNVYNLQHGIMEWNLQNLPIIIDPNAKPDTENETGIERYTSLINSDSLVFIDFYAPWCGPCRKMMPIIDSLKVDYYTNINFIKINVDASKKLVKDLKLIGVPYLALYYKGELLFSKNSAMTRDEIKNIFELNISKFRENAF